ncbi:hypothetical protein GIB67_019179 [Kingdonia uniflora]|uniref:Uncharacterized protein n=1 Tax=Kingdonia uniflora TaxID=39325 RepID=A0A7J7N061_9MAGN|nr:hypothetical protein GIB67_019179 [Kingdonia uniflora]
MSVGLNYLFHEESTQHNQSGANASIPVEAVAPEKEKGKGRKKRAPVKQRRSVQVPEDAEFLDETDDAGLHWMDAYFTCLARAWGIVVQVRFQHDSGKIDEDRENGAHRIYQGMNGGNDFKHCEAYKILA